MANTSITKETIRGWWDNANRLGAEHLLLFSEDGEGFYPDLVMPGETIDEVKNRPAHKRVGVNLLDAFDLSGDFEAAVAGSNWQKSVLVFERSDFFVASRNPTDDEMPLHYRYYGRDAEVEPKKNS